VTTPSIQSSTGRAADEKRTLLPGKYAKLVCVMKVFGPTPMRKEDVLVPL
jgi:hypothetical protein